MLEASASGGHALVDDALVARAGAIGTASLHEASGRLGALPHLVKPIDPAMHVAGRALPVRSPLGDNLWLHRAIAAASPGDLLVVDAGDTGRFGYWGEIMASAALARGIVGLVTSGGVRDSLRLRELGLPTFAAGVSILGTIKNPAGDGAVGEPVRLGEVVVRRGDLVVGDADGVWSIPAARAAVVVADAERRDAEEQHILRRIAAGETTIAIYNLPESHS